MGWEPFPQQHVPLPPAASASCQHLCMAGTVQPATLGTIRFRIAYRRCRHNRPTGTTTRNLLGSMSPSIYYMFCSVYANPKECKSCRQSTPKPTLVQREWKERESSRKKKKFFYFFIYIFFQYRATSTPTTTTHELEHTIQSKKKSQFAMEYCNAIRKRI